MSTVNVAVVHNGCDFTKYTPCQIQTQQNTLIFIGTDF